MQRTTFTIILLLVLFVAASKAEAEEANNWNIKDLILKLSQSVEDDTISELVSNITSKVIDGAPLGHLVLNLLGHRPM